MAIGGKRREWSLSENPPINAGFYLRENTTKNGSDRAFWDGANWYHVIKRAGKAPAIASSPHSDQARRWVEIPNRIAEEVAEGQRFNHLTFVRNVGSKSENGRWLAIFKCDCGNEKAMNLYEVRLGRHKSCGCMRLAAEVRQRLRDQMVKWASDNKDLVLENNKAVALSNTGRKRENPRSRAWQFNINSRYFEFANENGEIIKGWNLAELIRANEHLFDKDDVNWAKHTCRALKGLYQLYQKKRPAKSWKGWARISSNDRINAVKLAGEIHDKHIS